MHSRTLTDVLTNVEGKEHRIIVASGKHQPAAQNWLLDEAFKHDPEYIWFVDDDMKLPPGTLDELIAAQADIALADYPVAGSVHSAQRINGVQLGGMGCVLARPHVFDEIGYFRTDLTYSLPDLTPKQLSREEALRSHGGHDIDFFVKAGQLKSISIIVIRKTVGQYVWQDKPLGNDTGFKITEWNFE